MSYIGYPAVIPIAALTTAGGTYQGWLKYTKAYTDFSDAGLFKSIALYTLPIGGIVQAVKTKHSVAFSGGGATTATIEVGLSGFEQKYGPAFNVFQAVANDTFQYCTVGMTENHTATTGILVTLRASVALNSLAAGSVTLWLLISTAT
jgi:hypothetical protein